MVYEIINRTWWLSTRKLIAFIVITYKQQLSAVSKSTIGWPPLSIQICLGSECWYQNWFSINGPKNADFVFTAVAIRQTGELSNMFSRINWFRPAGSFAPEKKMQACPFFSRDNHQWVQYEERKTKNQQFQNWRWCLVDYSHVKCGRDLVSRSRTSIFGNSNSKMEKKSTPNLPYNR